MYFAEVGSAIFFPGPQYAIPHIFFVVWKVFIFMLAKNIIDLSEGFFEGAKPFFKIMYRCDQTP